MLWCRLVRGGIFFNLIRLAKKKRRWETTYGFPLAFFGLFEGDMKYLTKEWYVKARLSYIDGSVRCSKLAEKFDESFYKTVYQKKYEKFECNERLRDEFRDPKGDLKRYDDWINEPNISQEEKERRIKHKILCCVWRKSVLKWEKFISMTKCLLKKCLMWI